MNATEFIRHDHERIEELFRDFFETETETSQEDIFQLIETGLTAHSEMEEQVFYPALEEFAPDKVEEALREHAEVKEMLVDLLDADLNEETFESKFQKLMDDVRKHVQEEEAPGGILEIAEKSLDRERLSRMANEMLNVQRRIKEDLAA
jgi:hemerythrin superfamily protein